MPVRRQPEQQLVAQGQQFVADLGRLACVAARWRKYRAGPYRRYCKVVRFLKIASRLMLAYPQGMVGSSLLKEKVRHLPDKPGVYLMKDRLGRIIYVGKANSLKRRVSSYFQRGRARTQHPKIRALIGMIEDFDTIEVRSEPEALLLEGKLIKEWRPRYNTDFTDDKRFLLVRVDTGEELPRFRLTRLRKEDRSRYFGPFVHSSLLRKTLAQMRRRFGILLGDGTPRKLGDGTWQLYDDVRRELYGFPNAVAAGTTADAWTRPAPSLTESRANGWRRCAGR